MCNLGFETENHCTPQMIRLCYGRPTKEKRGRAVFTHEYSLAYTMDYALRVPNVLNFFIIGRSVEREKDAMRANTSFMSCST
eukprot:8076910-Pyramimonas_sp.AAC.4